MDKNEIMKFLQKNKKDDKKKIVLIFIASLVAMAAAVYGIFHMRKPDKAGAKKVQKTEKQPKARETKAKKVSASKKSARINTKRISRHVKKKTAQPLSADASQKATATVPQQVYVVNPLPEKKQESKARRFRRHMSVAVAVILVVSLVGSGTMNYVQPTTVLAQGSFTGIGRIVEDHSNGEPYVILDIVPTVATYGEYEFSTGTMGYLVNGQAPIVQDIKKHFTDSNNAAFFNYADRKKLLDAVNANAIDFPSIYYREAYGGISGLYDVSASSSWIPMFGAIGGISADNAEDFLSGEGDQVKVPTGLITGKAVYVDDDGGNFVRIDEGEKWKVNKTSLDDGYYELNTLSGDYQVMFTPSPVGKYVADDNAISLASLVASGTSGVSGASSLVYQKVDNGDGTFSYVPTGQTVLEVLESVKERRVKKNESNSEHKHELSGEWSSDDDFHWHVCTAEDCPEGFDEKVEHSWIYGPDGVPLECSVCGRSFSQSNSENNGNNKAPCYHENIENAALQWDGVNHWKECPDCHKKLNSGHDWSSDFVQGEDGHWQVCTACGETTESSSHNPNDDGVCETCGKYIGTTEDSSGNSSENIPSGSEGGGEDKAEHVHSLEWRHSDTQHWQECTGCDYTEIERATGHEWTDDADTDCNVCGYPRTVESSNDNLGETYDDGLKNGNDSENIVDTDTQKIDDTDTFEVTKNTAVSGRWMKLAVGDASEGIEETGEQPEPVDPTDPVDSTDPMIDPEDGLETNEEVDWNVLYIVTFRVLGADETPDPGETLYEANERQRLSSTEGVYDVYEWVQPEEEPGIMPMSMLLEFPVLGGANSGEVDGQFLYVGEGGDWKLERVADGSTGSDENGVAIGTIELYNVPVYFQCNSTGHDWLKQYVFSTLSDGDNPNNDFEIEVRTILASTVTAEEVYAADLVFLESGQNNAMLSSALTTKYIIGSGAEGADMNADAVQAVLQRAVEELMPVIVDYDITQDGNYGEYNYQLLARAMLKRDLLEFYSVTNVNDALIDNIRNGLKDGRYDDKADGNYNYVNQNVYVFNGSPLVGPDFPYELGESSGFSDVLSMIRAENAMRSEDNKIPESVSKAMVMQFIINASVGIIGEIGNLNILELQPTANDGSDLRTEVDSKGYTKLILQTEKMASGMQVLTNKNSFSISSEVKSVAEFNGRWEDINGKYDLVFIGLDGKKLNMEDDDRERTPLYNNSSLDGKVYHRGDSSNTDLGNYDANDITVQKKVALLEYMAAGYPVLVENDCFTNGSAQKATADDVNTDYIDADSVMCSFLKAAVSDDSYKDRIYTVYDARIGSMFLTQLMTPRPRISLVMEDGEDSSAESAVQPMTQDENGDYRGQIAYTVTNGRGEAYESPEGWTVSLYMDYDYDGVFESGEEVTEYVNEDGVIDVTLTNMGSGILPWKLEVTDSGNEYRRDSVQGYFKIGSTVRGELKVLQITERADDEYVNLQTMFNTNADSMLADYLRGAGATLNSDMQFETVNATELLIRLVENVKYLDQWDVVVLNLEGMDGADPMVATAVTEYVNAGRSLLVCGSMDSATSRAGLSADLLGQTDSSTYVWLGANGASGYQRYKGLNSDMYGGSTGLLAQSVNEGSISHYPYEIQGDSFTVGADVSLRASAYLLDLDNNPQSDTDAYTTYVTPWYTFGGMDTAYGVSPRDAANNYYCYSKGNVVYLAQSRYPYVKDSSVGVAESKFFVNALVAAYSAGIHNANVRIVAGFAEDSQDVENIAVPFDQIWFEDIADSSRGILDDTVEVYFKFRDNNIARSKSVIVGYYYQNPNSSDLVDVGGKLVQASPFPTPTPLWTVINNRLTLVEDGTLEPGQVYRIQAPVITLRENEAETKADIYIVIKTTFERGGKTYEIISSDSVSLNRAQLFLLE